MGNCRCEFAAIDLRSRPAVFATLPVLRPAGPAPAQVLTSQELKLLDQLQESGGMAIDALGMYRTLGLLGSAFALWALLAKRNIIGYISIGVFFYGLNVAGFLT